MFKNTDWRLGIADDTMGLMTAGRPRRFDEQQALAAAVSVFRERGFKGASIQALSSAMNMGEQSIYNAFGNKEALFNRALDQYCTDAEQAFDVLSAPGASLASIEVFFDMILGAMGDGAPSCLIAQTYLAGPVSGVEATRRARHHMQRVEDRFCNAVVRARERGELACDDPRAIARFLTMTLSGLSVMAGGGASNNALRDIVGVALGAIHT